MDDEYFLRDLIDYQDDVNEEGYGIRIKDWQRDPEIDDGDLIEYPHFLFEIDGDYWFDKFAEDHSDVFETIERQGSQAINVLGVTGLVNSIYSIWVWFRFLSDFSAIDGFWGAWFGVCFANGALWIPLTLLFPAANYGSLLTVKIVRDMAQATFIGPFFAYWANLIALYYTMYVQPDAAGSDFASNPSDGNLLILFYLVLSAANSAVSFLYVEQVEDYYDQLVLEFGAQETVTEEAEEESFEDEVVSPVIIFNKN